MLPLKLVIAAGALLVAVWLIDLVTDISHRRRNRRKDDDLDGDY